MLVAMYRYCNVGCYVTGIVMLVAMYRYCTAGMLVVSVTLTA